MANVKISALPQIDGTATTKNTIVASVDSGSTTTSKITLGDLFQNGSLIDDFSSNYYNSFLSAGGPANGASVGAEFRGSTSESSIIAGNGYIDAGTNNVLIGNLEAAGGNVCNIQGGANQALISNSFRGYISGGERNAVIASSDFEIMNAYNGVIIGSTNNCYLYQGPSVIAGSQGISVNANRVLVGGSEALSVNTNMSAAIASYGGTIQGNLYNVVIGTYSPTYDALSGALENGIQLGARESTTQNQRSSMISTSGRTSVFDGTAHVDNIHIFSTESKAIGTGGTVSGAVSVDISQQSVLTFTLGGNISSITFNNYREGGFYEFWVYNSGSYTITASGVTLGGTSNTVYAKGGALNPTNNGYTYYRMLIVNGVGILDEHLNFSAL